jgi:hypothetical protein
MKARSNPERKLFRKVDDTAHFFLEQGRPTNHLTDQRRLGMERAHFSTDHIMLTLTSLILLLGSLGVCVWWACLNDRNET